MRTLKDLQLFDDRIPSKEGKPRERNYFLKPTINPYLVYTVFKDNFGEPNCFDIDEDKQRWEWTFSYKDFFVEIYDWKLFSTSICIYHLNSDIEESKTLAEKINSLLLKEAQQKKTKIKNLIKGSKHKVLENPFVTYYSTAENLLAIAAIIENLFTCNLPQIVKDQVNKRPSKLGIDFDFELWHKKDDLFRSAFLMFLSSFEGFLNIMYELYLKVELRGDRIYDKISREQIDIKLRIAPIYCDGFKTKTINNEDKRFKDYLQLVNLRNDYVHANLTKSLERYIIEEDDLTFIIENEDNAIIPSNINQLRLEHVELAKTIIDNVIELVFESMEPKTKREFKNLIYDEEIELIDDDGFLMPI